MIRLVLDHLWQSTLFVAAAGFLTLFFKVNAARVRYGIWLAASLKFLFPLALLTAAGKIVSQALPPAPTAMPTPGPVIMALDGATEPFSRGAVAITGVTTAATNAAPPWNWVALLAAVWFAGFAFAVIRWLRHWLYLRRIVRVATPVAIQAPMPVKSSPALLEPGLVGAFHPVLLLPEGVAGQLSAGELEAVVAHEVCHWRRRDNLTAALHMLVEAIFWFYPLVWWLETRLIAEREVACDEAVIAAGRDPDTYAESILKVCRLYVHSPLPCAAGVSGADLKQRMEKIMENQSILRLSAVKKAVLAGSALSVLIAPITLGLLTTPPVVSLALAQTADAPHPGTEAALRHQIESMQAGQPDYSVMVPSLAEAAHQQADNGGLKIQTWGALKSITFRENQNGNDVYLVEFENQLSVWTISPLQPDGKIGPVLFFGPAIKRDGNTPSPGLEAAIRQDLDGGLSGHPALEIMSVPLQRAVQNQWKMISADSQALGAVQTIAFQKVNARGWDVYNVTFANGTATVQAVPLADGKLTGILESDILLPHAPQHPGTEAWMRRHIAAVLSGTPNYDDMGMFLANAVRQQWPNQISFYKSLGPLQSLTFEGGGSVGMDGNGVDVYLAQFQNGKVRWHIEAPDANGKVNNTLFYQKVN